MKYLVGASLLLVATNTNVWAHTRSRHHRVHRTAHKMSLVAMAIPALPSAAENAAPQGAISFSHRGAGHMPTHAAPQFPVATLPDLTAPRTLKTSNEQPAATAESLATAPQAIALQEVPASSISEIRASIPRTASTRHAAQPLRIAALPASALPPTGVTKASLGVAQPTVAQPATAKAPATSPQTAPATEAKATPAQAVATPAVLSSRHKDMLVLQQLEADLDRTEHRLKNANAALSEGQRQIINCSNIMQQAMMEAGPDARGLNPFVRVAQRYAGTPYVWGGESARGFDCSGFIMRVMRDLGYPPLPHSAAEQFTYGKPIAQALLKPGDLVFFKNTYKPGISHVGIYLGKRRFIHAAGTGTGTIVSSLDSTKFQEHYAGARRLIPARGGN
jgi:cell wall-associated NlpC family hydrolase